MNIMYGHHIPENICGVVIETGELKWSFLFTSPFVYMIIVQVKWPLPKFSPANEFSLWFYGLT